ncbi:hypothetical protein TNCV_1500871 [Trichonephila clavipes]|uniref:Uncharacterized protein n=1 Tax=Trichonephila clavipes TaxID=2585209 RepID=A0A8X6RTI3_TRICX|nr:hypothetical protein TNCV_1500871 [Trichonephila clavipes]
MRDPISVIHLSSRPQSVPNYMRDRVAIIMNLQLTCHDHIKIRRVKGMMHIKSVKILLLAWCGRSKTVPVQVSSKSLNLGSKLRDPSSVLHFNASLTRSGP